MIKEEINIYPTVAALSEGFTAFVRKLQGVYPHINLALSGGNTPKAIFEYWGDNCQETIDWKRISLFWGDERCVSPENAMSNYGMTKKSLLSKFSQISLSDVKRIHGENEPEEEAEWYSRVLERRLLRRSDVPCFELIMLGLGDDGHTVSIFPHQMDLWNSRETCVVAQHPETGQKRISVTGRVVNGAQYAVFLVTGKNKAEKVKDIIKNRKEFTDLYPAARVNPENGYLYWFLDEDAASLL